MPQISIGVLAGARSSWRVLVVMAGAAGCGSSARYSSAAIADAAVDVVVAQSAADGGAGDAAWVLGDAGAALVPGSVCTGDGWCWMNPLPAGGTGQSWSLSKDEAWVVGASGLILRWSSGAWSFSESGTRAPLAAVWAAGDTDAWAVGAAGAILHWDGTQWSKVSAPVSTDLRAVYGSGPADVWAVGGAGSAVHWDGTAWSAVPPLADAGATTILGGVWVASPTRAWAVGSPGILGWDGRSWTPVAGAPGPYGGVWGASPNDVWAGGAADDNAEFPTPGRKPLAHWDGTSWTFRQPPTAGAPASTIAPFGLTSVWGTSARDVWATTDSNVPAWEHWDGSAWTLVSTLSRDLVGLRLGGGYGGVFAGLWHDEGASWVDRGADAIYGSGGTNSVDEMWFSSPSDGWIVDSNGVLHWDGSGWSRSLPSVHPAALYSVHGTAPDDVWAVGAPGVVMHWDGATWSRTGVGGNSYLRAVRAMGRSDVWAIAYDANGARHGVWHFDGSSWTLSLSLSSAPGGLWGSATDDVWVGTDSGDVEHWDGTTWTSASTPASTMGGLGAISGSGKNDVWAAGGYGGVLHWDGTSWSVSTLSGQFLALAARAPDDVWAVGYQSAILHWDGRVWAPSAVHGLVSDLFAASVLPDGTVWIGGGVDVLRHGP
jgi:hypothetical protein